MQDDQIPQVHLSSDLATSPDSEVNADSLLGSRLDPNLKHRPRSLLGAKQAGDRGWYVIHTYTGYEDQVAETLRQRIESLGLGDKVFDVIVPTE